MFVKNFIMTEKIIADVRDKILDHLKNDDRTLKWVSDKTEIPYSSLYSIFIQKIFNLNQERLDLINTLLGTKFKL